MLKITLCKENRREYIETTFSCRQTGQSVPNCSREPRMRHAQDGKRRSRLRRRSSTQPSREPQRSRRGHLWGTNLPERLVAQTLLLILANKPLGQNGAASWLCAGSWTGGVAGTTLNSLSLSLSPSLTERQRERERERERDHGCPRDSACPRAGAQP